MTGFVLFQSPCSGDAQLLCDLTSSAGKKDVVEAWVHPIQSFLAGVWGWLQRWEPPVFRWKVVCGGGGKGKGHLEPCFRICRVLPRNPHF